MADAHAKLLGHVGTDGRLPWNWRQRIEIVILKRHRRGTISFSLQWIEGKEPPGFFGDIGFLGTDLKGFVLQSDVHWFFQKRGLGSILYRHALKHFGKLATAWWEGHSGDARHVWESLIAEYQYKTDFFSGELTVFNRRHRRTTKKG